MAHRIRFLFASISREITDINKDASSAYERDCKGRYAFTLNLHIILKRLCTVDQITRPCRAWYSLNKKYSLYTLTKYRIINLTRFIQR